jgi:hypothetical protein
MFNPGAVFAMIKNIYAPMTAMILLLVAGCQYAPYPEGEPQSYEECVRKSTKDFTNPDPRRAMILTEKACKEKFPRR